MTNYLQMANSPDQTLNGFLLEDLAQFKREKSFPRVDSPDYRTFFVGRDDVHGCLKYLHARCSRSYRLNMFGYDDDELDSIIKGMVESEHIFVQGTLDSRQASGAHEKAIIGGWSEAMRSSFAIGESATHQISHTKGGVLDMLVMFEGSTNWSASGEGWGKVAQNNTLTVCTDPTEIAMFATELDEEHVTALQQQLAKAA